MDPAKKGSIARVARTAPGGRPCVREDKSLAVQRPELTELFVFEKDATEVSDRPDHRDDTNGKTGRRDEFLKRKSSTLVEKQSRQRVARSGEEKYRAAGSFVQ